MRITIGTKLNSGKPGTSWGIPLSDPCADLHTVSTDRSVSILVLQRIWSVDLYSQVEALLRRCFKQPEDAR